MARKRLSLHEISSCPQLERAVKPLGLSAAAAAAAMSAAFVEATAASASIEIIVIIVVIIINDICTEYRDKAD